MERKHQIIESLLAKPSKKPDFASFKGSDVLKRAQEFMPMFIQTTDRLLADPDLLKASQMDIKVIDQDTVVVGDRNEDHEMIEQVEGQDEKKLITMVRIIDRDHFEIQDIGVGVYDILNENFNEEEFKTPLGKSSEPIVRVKGMPNEMVDSEDSSSDDGSDDSNLYYEFNSDSDDRSDVQSHTTKSTEQKRPMIIDITSN